MATGIVKKYNDRHGYGFLFPLGEKPDADLIFFHGSQLIGTSSLPIGAEVRFQKIRSDKGCGIEAAHVELLELGGRRTLREAEREQQRERQRLRFGSPAKAPRC